MNPSQSGMQVTRGADGQPILHLTKEQFKAAVKESLNIYGGEQLVKDSIAIAEQHGGIDALRQKLQTIPDLEGKLESERDSNAALKVTFEDYQRETSGKIEDAESEKTRAEERVRILEGQLGSEQTIAKNIRDELAEKNRVYESDVSGLTEDIERLTNQVTLDASAHQAQLGELQGKYNTSQSDLSAAKKDAEDYKKESSKKISDAEAERKKAEARAAEAERKYSKLEQDVSGNENAHKAELDAKDRLYNAQLGESAEKLKAAEDKITGYESGAEVSELRIKVAELALEAGKADMYRQDLQTREEELAKADERVREIERDNAELRDSVEIFYNQARNAISGRTERGRKVPSHSS
jgi:chromosome segregation ATPase